MRLQADYELKGAPHGPYAVRTNLSQGEPFLNFDWHPGLVELCESKNMRSVISIAGTSFSRWLNTRHTTDLFPGHSEIFPMGMISGCACQSHGR
jgi:hypothetical protein